MVITTEITKEELKLSLLVTHDLKAMSVGLQLVLENQPAINISERHDYHAQKCLQQNQSRRS